MITLKQFWLVYQTEWVADPFVLKFYFLIQNNISPNFSYGLNFVTCELFLQYPAGMYGLGNTRMLPSECGRIG